MRGNCHLKAIQYEQILLPEAKSDRKKSIPKKSQSNQTIFNKREI